MHMEKVLTCIKWGIFLIILAAIILFAMMYFVIPALRHRPIAERNEELRLALTGQKPDTVTTLEEVIPFEWDDAYIFGPYVYSEESLEEWLGVKLPEYHETLYDGMINVILVKDKKVICYECAKVEGVGYQFDIEGQIHCGDRIPFSVKFKNGLMTYESMEEST